PAHGRNHVHVVVARERDASLQVVRAPRWFVRLRERRGKEQDSHVSSRRPDGTPGPPARYAARRQRMSPAGANLVAFSQGRCCSAAASTAPIACKGSAAVETCPAIESNTTRSCVRIGRSPTEGSGLPGRTRRAPDEVAAPHWPPGDRRPEC